MNGALRVVRGPAGLRLQRAVESRQFTFWKDESVSVSTVAELVRSHGFGLEVPTVVADAPTGRTISETIAELNAFTKRDRIANDGRALDDLERRAEQIRKNERELTKQQAFAKAIREDPELYERHRRHEIRKSGVDVDVDLVPAQPLAHDAAIRARASEISKADESLTPQQAYARALIETAKKRRET